MVRVGAWATITELLAPIANNDDPSTFSMRSSLAIAYSYHGQLEEAIRQGASTLSHALRAAGKSPLHSNVLMVRRQLLNFAIYLDSADSSIEAQRCLEFREAINAACGAEPDANLLMNRAEYAADRGDIGEARRLIGQARALENPPDTLWYADQMDCVPLYLNLIEHNLTHGQIDNVATRVNSWVFRRNLVDLRCELFIQEGKYEPALTAAQEHEQLSHNAGLDVAPARSSFLLAKLGRTAEAEAAVEDALIRLNRIYPSRRPCRYLALALRELGRLDEAREYARLAYRQAWADGPPYCRYWDLRDARELLDSMGEPYPDLPVTDPATVKVPLEDEIRAFIADLEKSKRATGTGSRAEDVGEGSQK